VPKNYAKAFLKYIKFKEDDVTRLTGGPLNFKKFLKKLENRKDKVLSIKEFKNLMVYGEEDTEDLDFHKILRTMAYKFIREELNSYIFANKKIRFCDVLFKYKRVIEMGIVLPEKFYSWNIDLFLEDEDLKKTLAV